MPAVNWPFLGLATARGGGLSCRRLAAAAANASANASMARADELGEFAQVRRARRDAAAAARAGHAGRAGVCPRPPEVSARVCRQHCLIDDRRSRLRRHLLIDVLRVGQVVR